MLKVVDNYITLTRGDACNLVIDVRDAEGEVHTLEENETLYFTMSKNIGDENVLIHKPLLGNILVLTVEDTISLELGVYVYDITLEVNGNKYTIIPPKPFKLTGEVHNNVIL